MRQFSLVGNNAKRQRGKIVKKNYQQIKNKLTDEVNIKEFYDIEANVRNLEMLLKSVSMN